MNDDIMTPDRYGYIRVFVGGKYPQWQRQVSVEPGDDVVFLAPLGDEINQHLGEHPDQLDIFGDENYSTMRLGGES